MVGAKVEAHPQNLLCRNGSLSWFSFPNKIDHNLIDMGSQNSMAPTSFKVLTYIEVQQSKVRSEIFLCKKESSHVKSPEKSSGQFKLSH